MCIPVNLDSIEVCPDELALGKGASVPWGRGIAGAGGPISWEAVEDALIRCMIHAKDE